MLQLPDDSSLCSKMKQSVALWHKNLTWLITEISTPDYFTQAPALCCQNANLHMHATNRARLVTPQQQKPTCTMVCCNAVLDCAPLHHVHRGLLISYMRKNLRSVCRQLLPLDGRSFATYESVKLMHVCQHEPANIDNAGKCSKQFCLRHGFNVGML